MTGQQAARDYRISKARLEALVDGIFAFAMTLLVTGLAVPTVVPSEASTVLPGKIMAMRPEFFSFIIAFFILASFWLVHHRNFHYVRSVDPVLVRTNLVILALVVLMPFTTNLSGDYSEALVAVDLFHANMCILGLLFLFHWWYLTRHTELTDGEIGRQDAVTGIRRALVTPLVAAAGLLLSFISPSLSMAVYLLLIPAHYLASRLKVC